MVLLQLKGRQLLLPHRGVELIKTNSLTIFILWQAFPSSLSLSPSSNCIISSLISLSNLIQSDVYMPIQNTFIITHAPLQMHTCKSLGEIWGSDGGDCDHIFLLLRFICLVTKGEPSFLLSLCTNYIRVQIFFPSGCWADGRKWKYKSSANSSGYPVFQSVLFHWAL